jgi:DNA polymerase III subunit epsilon
MTGSTDDWATAPLVALDLEGSGAQDYDDEAILEIAMVPLVAGQPDTAAAYSTLINPGRHIPRRPWISPGLTNTALATAPTPAEVEPELAGRINGHILAGHNIGVDWRLLHRRHPGITPTALIDTLRLARYLKLGTKNSLITLTTQLGLTPQIEGLADGSQPHRALWDTIAAALLLPTLIAKAWPTGATPSPTCWPSPLLTFKPPLPPMSANQLRKTPSSVDPGHTWAAGDVDGLAVRADHDVICAGAHLNRYDI